MRTEKLHITPEEQAEKERAEALAARNAATIDYIAMMCDVEIPEMEASK